jgi:hypothetical protein
MKTIFRTFGMVALLAAFLAVGGLSAFGQDCDTAAIEAQYKLVTDGYRSTDLATFEKAVDAAKVFLEKYGSCEPAKESADWGKKKLPGWETDLSDRKKTTARSGVLTRFDEAIKAKNWDAAYTAGDEFSSKYPNDDARINLIVPLAWIGFQEASNKNNKFNANAIRNAKAALEILKAGTVKPKPSGGYGAFQFECSSKDECISFLTYAIGYITYFGDGNKQAAVPYYYEATKLPGTFKTNPAVYGTIGDYYYETVRKLADEVKGKIADQKDTDPDDVKAKKEADIKQAIGMLNGYTERAMDAYSRAYNIAKADPKAKTYADTVYKQIQALYTVRFQKQEGIDAWIAARVNQPFPDPTSAVAPVVDAESSTGNTNAPAAAPTATPSAPAKPAANGPAKPGTTTTKVGATSSTTTPAAKAGSAVAKKKGTK